MSNILALSSPSGKIFSSKQDPSASGLLLKIDYKTTKHCSKASKLLLSSSGDWMIVSDSKGYLTYFHLARNKFAVIARGCQDVKCMEHIRNTPEEVAVSLGNCTIQIYQVTGKLISSLKGHKDPATSMQACPSNKLLISCSPDVCIIWSSTNWNRERSLYSNPPGFIAGYIIDEIQALGILDSEGTIVLWDLKNFENSHRLYANEPLVSASFSGSDGKAVGLGESGDIIVWSLKNSKAEFRLKHNPQPSTVKWWKNSILIVIGKDGRLYITDLKTSKIIGEIKNELFVEIQISNSGKLIAVDKQGNVQVYDLNCALGIRGKENIKHEVIPVVPPPVETKKTSIKDQELKKMLVKFGEFPEKHRITIWKTLLKLPLNLTFFDNLLRKGEHPSVSYIQKRFPLKDRHLMDNFSKVMSALAFWCPILAETEHFPAIVFPFVKLAGDELIVAFELILTLLFNWLGTWFENFPQPPVKYLIQIEDVIKSEEPKLSQHLANLDISCSAYIWPILKYLFTQVMTKEEFCIVIDHLFTNYTKPELLICISAAYIIYFKSTLLSLTNPQDIQGFFVQQNPLNVMKLLKLALKLVNKPTHMQCLVPLPEEYPLFTNYPEFALSLQISIRERLIKQDEEIQLKKNYIEDINKKFHKLEEDELKFRREQETLVHVEGETRKISVFEENCRLKERQSLDQEARKIRLDQIHRMEETIDNSLKSQEALRKKELASIELEMNSRAEAERYYAQAKHEEDHLSLLEYKAAQRMLELMRLKNTEESMRKLKIHAQHWEREQSQRERILRNQWNIENEQRRIDLEMMRETKLKELEMCTEFNNKRRLDAQQNLKTLERELKMMDLEKEKQLRLIAEEELVRNEEYLAQLRIKQELLGEHDERQFQVMLVQEKEFKKQKNEELLRDIRREQEKQAVELRRQREENERLERELEKKAIDNKILEMRQESDLMAREKEKLMQETLLKIEEERNAQRKLNQELEYRRKEIKERNAYQKVVRDNVDEALLKEREEFYKFKEEINRETTELEYQRKRLHERKMNEILQQREEALQQISQPVPRFQQGIKEHLQEYKTYSDEENQPSYLIPSENSAEEILSNNSNDIRFYKNRQSKGYQEEQYDGIFGESYKKSGNAHKSKEGGKNFEIKEQTEESNASSQKRNEKGEKFDDKTRKNNAAQEDFGENFKRNELNFEDHTKKNVGEDGLNLFQFKKTKNFNAEKASERFLEKSEKEEISINKVTKKNLEKETAERRSLEDSDRKSGSLSDYDKVDSSIENFRKDYKTKNEENDFKTYSKFQSNPKKYQAEFINVEPNEIEYRRNYTPKDEMFDLKKITEYNKEYHNKSDAPHGDWNPITKKFNENKVQIYEDESDESERSEEHKMNRKQWDEDSYSKSSESRESSSLSYHHSGPYKSERLFISKTQKPEIDHSANWEKKSDASSSYHSHECSSCVYSSSEHTSECSCDCSSEESSPAIVSPRNYYESNESSEDST